MLFLGAAFNENTIYVINECYNLYKSDYIKHAQKNHFINKKNYFMFYLFCMEKFLNWCSKHPVLFWVIALVMWFFPVEELYANDKPTGKKYNIFGFPLPVSPASAFNASTGKEKEAESKVSELHYINECTSEYIFQRGLGKTENQALSYCRGYYGDVIDVDSLAVDMESAYQQVKGTYEPIEQEQKKNATGTDKLINALENNSKGVDTFKKRFDSVEK